MDGERRDDDAALTILIDGMDPFAETDSEAEADPDRRWARLLVVVGEGVDSPSFLDGMGRFAGGFHVATPVGRSPDTRPLPPCWCGATHRDAAGMHVVFVVGEIEDRRVAAGADVVLHLLPHGALPASDGAVIRGRRDLTFDDWAASAVLRMMWSLGWHGMVCFAFEDFHYLFTRYREWTYEERNGFPTSPAEWRVDEGAMPEEMGVFRGFEIGLDIRLRQIKETADALAEALPEGADIIFTVTTMGDEPIDHALVGSFDSGGPFRKVRRPGAMG